MKTAGKILMLLIFAASFSACKKIQGNIMIKGKWEVRNVKTDFVQMDNAMEFFLPGYESNSESSKYYVDFKEDETVTGTFIKDNVTMQIDSGVWHLDKFNILYVKLGKYIDGTYDVDRQKDKKYQLTTDENKLVILASQPPEITNVVMDIERLKD